MKKIIVSVAIGLLTLCGQVWAGTYDTCVEQANLSCIDGGKVQRLCWLETFMQCCAGTPLETEYPQRMRILDTVKEANKFVAKRWADGDDWRILRPYPDGRTPVRFRGRWLPESPEEMMEE